MGSNELCFLWKKELAYPEKVEISGLTNQAWEELPAHIATCENCRLTLEKHIDFLPRTTADGEVRFVWEVIWFKALCLKPMESMTPEMAKIVAERLKKYAHDKKILV